MLERNSDIAITLWDVIVLWDIVSKIGTKRLYSKLRGGDSGFDRGTTIDVIVGSKRREAWCICVRARNSAMDLAVGTDVGPSQTAAMGGANKGSITLLATTANLRHIELVVTEECPKQYEGYKGNEVASYGLLVLNTMSSC
ncbi:hypothetical protein RB195_018804 [Necator americanus]|uniref:Uncharacterized protein n=1 Tax=Necator americanus TaxID=51031 RepID=A0ABR1CBC2_NECAM